MLGACPPGTREPGALLRLTDKARSCHSSSPAAGIIIVVSLRQQRGRGSARVVLPLALGAVAGVATESAYRLDAFGHVDPFAVWGPLLVLLSIGTVIACRRSLVR